MRTRIATPSDVGHWFAMTGTGLVKFAVILSERSEPKDLNENTDCHTSDISHWFAMTGLGILRRAVYPAAEAAPHQSLTRQLPLQGKPRSTAPSLPLEGKVARHSRDG